MKKIVATLGLFSLLLSSNWSDPTVSAQSNDSSVYLELRPPCLSYTFADSVETSPPADLTDIIMDDQLLLDEEDYPCYPFGEQDFSNRISPPVAVGDVIAIDLVINNVEDQLDILGAGAWLTYDSDVLEGMSISINEDEDFNGVFDSVPGEANFDEANNLIKIEVETKSSVDLNDEWIPIGRLYFEVIDVPVAGNTIIGFAEGSNASETFIDGLPDGETLDDVLSETPQSLILQITDSGTSSSSVVSSTATSSLKAAEASCTTDNQCQSNLCYLNTCQAVGYTLPGGASCRDNNQCTSGLCNRNGTCQPVPGSSSETSSDTSSVVSSVVSSDSSPAADSSSSEEQSSSVVQVPEGGFCSYSSDCLTAVCYQGTCMAADFKIPDGGYCETDSSCASGSCVSNSCSETSRDTTSDSICRSNADCINQRCDNGQCVELLADNQACQEDTDCSSNACLIGICTSDASLPNGSSCQIDAQCASNFCQQGICEEEPDPLNQDNTPTLGGVGTSCNQNADCASQLCLEGICRAADDQQAQRTAFGLIQVQNFRVTTAGSTVYLSWDNLQSSWKAAYNIYYSSTSGRYLQRKTVSGADTNLVLNDLPEGTQYFFAIRAVSITNEESAFSNEISVVVGNPSTSTAPLTASSVFNPTPGIDGTNPINPGSNTEVPGETGLPAAAGMVLLFSAVAGTAFATKRQFVSLSEPHER